MRKYYSYDNLTNIPIYLSTELYGFLEYEFVLGSHGHLIKPCIVNTLHGKPVAQKYERIGKFWVDWQIMYPTRLRFVLDQPVWYK